MGWFLSSLKSLRRPSRTARQAPKRNRSLILEDLEGRRLPSLAVQSFVTLPNTTSNIISGPDGDLWVAVEPTPGAAAIDRIGLNGSVTSFPVSVGSSGSALQIVSLTTGPDGNVWFDANFAPTFTDSQVVIGKVTPAGQVTEFPPIPVSAGLGGVANSIVSGPDGDLWFGYTSDNLKFQGFKSQEFIGQVTTTGAITLFPISSFGSNSPLFVDSITPGADGNLWFTEGMVKHFVVGRMSPSGVVTQFPVGKLLSGDVANGPNSSLILTGPNTKLQNEVFDVSTTGAVTRYKIPAAESNAFQGYVGSADGSLWFYNGFSANFKIGRISASGVATSYNLSNIVRGQPHIMNSTAIGQDGNVYMLDIVIGPRAKITTTVYRLSPSELPPMSPVGTPKSRG
jgi:streptogramin lyase